jgi:hypothetical protein
MVRDIIRDFLNESYEQLAGKDAVLSLVSEIEITLDEIDDGTLEIYEGLNSIREKLNKITEAVDGMSRDYRSGDQDFS